MDGFTAVLKALSTSDKPVHVAANGISGLRHHLRRVAAATE